MPRRISGTRQAFLPGGHRTGAPGKHVVSGAAKYRLLDEKVRLFIAPPLQCINESPVSLASTCRFPSVFDTQLQLKPYVALDVRLTNMQRKAVFGNYPASGLTPEHYLKVAQAQSVELAGNQLTVVNGS